jgi:tryptophanyl-tRNA synthetase
MGQFREFVEKLRDDGRIKPVDVEQTIINLQTRQLADDSAAKDFAEGKAKGKTDLVEQYKNYLSAMPRVIDLNEELMKGRTPVSEAKDAAMAKDAEFVEAEIKRLRTANDKLTYDQALNMTGAMYPDKVQSYVESGFGS